MNRKTRLPAALLAAAVALIAAVFPLLSVKYGSIAAEPAYSATEQLPRLYESAARRTANRTAPKLSAKKPSANSEFYNEHDLNAALSFLETADSNGVKNGTKLWADYDANDPETWISVGWTEDGRLSIFDADFSSHLAIQSNVADEVGPVGELDLSGCEMLGSVSLVSTCVERLDVSDCPNLFLVSAFYDELKSIDLSGCSSLYFLWVCYNKDLRQIDLSGLSELGALALSGNGLESLDFSSNPHITEIDCSNNSLTALDVSMLSELQRLRCENQDWEMPNSNRISEIDLSHNPMLAEFACYNADVSAVDLSGCTSLQILNADNCPLNELDISDCSMLSVLSICGTNVSEIDLTSSGSMTTIALAGAKAFHVRSTFHALGGQAGLGEVAEVVGHGRAGGAAVGHKVHNGTTVGRLIFHSFQLFLGRGKIEIGHFDRAALDLHRDEQRFPVAAGGCFRRVHVFAGFVDLDILHGSDLDLAVVVLVGDYGGRTGAAGCGVVAGLGGLCTARAKRKHHDEREHKGKDLFHVLFSFIFLFTGHCLINLFPLSSRRSAGG